MTLEHGLVFFFFRSGDAPAQPPGLSPAGGQGQVLHDLRGGGGAQHGVLEHPADVGGPLVLGQAGHIGAADGDSALVYHPGAGHSVEHGGLARAVAADDGAEVAVLQGKAAPLERPVSH